MVDVGAAKLRRASGASGEHSAACDGVRPRIDPEYGIAARRQRQREAPRPGRKHEHAITRRKLQLARDDADLLAGPIVTDRRVPEAVKEVREDFPVDVRNFAGRFAVMVALQTSAVELGMVARSIRSLAYRERVLTA